MSTNHRLYFEWSNANLELSPKVWYNHYDNRNNYTSVAFNQDVLKRDNAEDSIFDKQLSATYCPFAINRNMRQGKSQGYEWQTGMTVKSKIKFNRIPDNITLCVRGSYKNSSTEKLEHNRIEYYKGQPTYIDFKTDILMGNLPTDMISMLKRLIHT